MRFNSISLQEKMYPTRYDKFDLKCLPGYAWSFTPSQNNAGILLSDSCLTEHTCTHHADPEQSDNN